MTRAFALACCFCAGCIPGFDGYSFVSDTTDSAMGGVDLDTTDAGNGCTPGAFVVPICDGAPHLLFTHSPTGYVTIERLAVNDVACASVTLPGVTGTARLVAERAASLAVAVGGQVAIASTGQIRCLGRAGHEPVDLFVRDDAFAVAWRPVGGGAIDAIELDGKGDLGVGTTTVLRVTQSPFMDNELVSSTGLTDTSASYTYDPDESVDPTQPYAFGAGVTLGAVAGGGGPRVAWVSESDPRLVYHTDMHTAAGHAPASSTCTVGVSRAIPSVDSGVTYRVLGTDGRARTLRTSGGTSGCTEDALNDLVGHAAPYDALGLGVVP